MRQAGRAEPDGQVHEPFLRDEGVHEVPDAVARRQGMFGHGQGRRDDRPRSPQDLQAVSAVQQARRAFQEPRVPPPHVPLRVSVLLRMPRAVVRPHRERGQSWVPHILRRSMPLRPMSGLQARKAVPSVHWVRRMQKNCVVSSRVRVDTHMYVIRIAMRNSVDIYFFCTPTPLVQTMAFLRNMPPDPEIALRTKSSTGTSGYGFPVFGGRYWKGTSPNTSHLSPEAGSRSNLQA